MSNQEEEHSNAYLKTLTEDEKLVIKIATKCLQSSFDITKSIGYLSWKAKNVL